MMEYTDNYKRSIEQKDQFWAEQAQFIPWYKQPKQTVEALSEHLYQWFSDGELNMSYACLDYHVEQGMGEQTAIIYDSPVTQTVEYITYNELTQNVARFASALSALGVTQGDTVIIYMPMIPQAIVSMLACARIGAIHSVVFGGFASHELAIRIDDAKPKVVITASHGIEVDKIIAYEPLVRAALAEAQHVPAHCILYERTKNKAVNSPFHSFDTLLEQNEPMNCVAVGSTHPLYILYTSGTTGTPKGIVRDTGGYATALHYSMRQFYNVKPGEVFWAASDVGWVVGHSYIVYGPLLQGCTSILYEGKPVKTPNSGSFWRVVEQHKVQHMFTAPTAIRAIKKEDPDGVVLKQYNLSSLQTLFLAGERCDPATFTWAENMLHKPVIDHWWQTESGWPMLGIMMGIEQPKAKAGSAGKPVCGFAVQILSEDGTQQGAGKEGFVAIQLPMPPGCLPTLWQNDERYIKGYLEQFAGYYVTGDGGYCDEDGYFYIMGRVDDVMNVAGHRLSTGEMEEIVASHPAVAECAVLGIADDLRGQRPVALVVVKDGMPILEQKLEFELVAMIRDKIGAVAYFKNALVVKRLPKTRSGKILRKTLRHIADGLPYNIPSTIDDPEILTEIELALSARKLGNAFMM